MRHQFFFTICVIPDPTFIERGFHVNFLSDPIVIDLGGVLASYLDMSLRYYMRWFLTQL